MEGTTTDEFPVCKVHKYSGLTFLTVVLGLAVIIFLDGRALLLHSCALLFLCFCSYLLGNGWYCDRKRVPGTSFIPTRYGMLPLQCFLEAIFCAMVLFIFTDIIFFGGEIYNDSPPKTYKDLAFLLLRWSILGLNTCVFMLVINQLMPPEKPERHMVLVFSTVGFANLRGHSGPVGRQGPSSEEYERTMREYDLWRRIAPSGPIDDKIRDELETSYERQDSQDPRDMPSSGVSEPAEVNS